MSCLSRIWQDEDILEMTCKQLSKEFAENPNAEKELDQSISKLLKTILEIQGNARV